MKTYDLIMDWSEVWAPLIPLIVWLVYRPKQKWVRPVLFYLIVAFVFSAVLDIIWKMQVYSGFTAWFDRNFPGWPKEEGYLKNTVFYNLISISRLLLFAWFFNYLGDVFRKLNRVVPWLFIAFTIINFWRFEPIEDFSSRLITLEAGILLFYCVLYFFRVLRDDKPDGEAASRQVFAVVMGLSIYVALNFFIFL